jgi:hypothetical protein
MHSLPHYEGTPCGGRDAHAGKLSALILCRRPRLYQLPRYDMCRWLKAPQLTRHNQNTQTEEARRFELANLHVSSHLIVFDLSKHAVCSSSRQHDFSGPYQQFARLRDDRTVARPPGSYVGNVEEEFPMIRQAAATVVALCLSASPLHAQSAAIAKRVTVSEASTAVHKTPSVASPVVGNAPRGTELVVTREVGDWVKVAWPSAADGVGYVRVSALASGNAPAPAVAKAPAAAAPKAAPARATAKAAPATGAKTAANEPAPVRAKAAVTPTASVGPVAVREQIPLSQPSAPSQPRTLYVAPTHVFGVGAMAGSSRGFGGSARAWKKGRIGMQLEVSRYTYDSVDLLSRASVTDIAPGALFALNDHVTDTVWLRPYVGAAAHFARSSRTDLIFPDVTESASTMGARVFVGSEVSLASVPQLALSADVGYYHQPEPFVGFEPGGIGVSVSAHWYVK